MDFIINDNGVLVKYTGLGGDVIIPDGVKYMEMSGVFDRTVQIKSIFLPKSFLGYCIASVPIEEPSNEKQEYSIFDYIDGVPQTPRQKRDSESLVRNADLPFLERYEVDPLNEHFASRDGLLYSKDFSALWDCPVCFTGRIVFDSSLKCIDYEAIGIRTKPLELEYTDKSANQNLLKLFREKASCPITFYALKLETYSDTNSQKLDPNDDWYDIEQIDFGLNMSLDYDSFIIIWPKVNPSHLSTVLQELNAYGFCLQPHLYLKKYVPFYNGLIRHHESRMYLSARRNKLRQVMSYIESLWQSWKLKEDLSYCPKVSRQTVKNCILHGSVKELKEVLSRYTDHFLETELILIASRYGGVNKVKCLLEFAGLLNSRKRSLVGEYDPFNHNPYLCFMVMHPRCKAFELFGHMMSGESGEFHNVEPSSEDERLKVVKLFIEQELLNEDMGALLCCGAYLGGCFKIASYLNEHGFRAGCFIHQTDLPIYVDFIKRSIEWACENQLDGLSEFLRALKDDGKPLGWRIDINIVKYCVDEQTTKIIFSYIKKQNSYFAPFAKALIRNDKAEIFKGILDSDYLKRSKTLDILLEYCMANKRHEFTTLILNYKDHLKQEKRQRNQKRLTI